MSKVVSGSGNVVPIRTFDPKFTHYFSDGNGRDNFINYNNGGYSIPKIFTPQVSSNYMRFRTASTNQTSPRKEAKPFEYHSDGSGRDSYIVCNSGGLKQMFNRTSGEQFFKDSLRQSDRRMYKSFRRGTYKEMARKPIEVDITMYRNWINPREQLKIQAMARQQKQLVAKLSPLRIGDNLSQTSKTPFQFGVVTPRQSGQQSPRLESSSTAPTEGANRVRNRRTFSIVETSPQMPKKSTEAIEDLKNALNDFKNSGITSTRREIVTPVLSPKRIAEDVRKRVLTSNANAVELISEVQQAKNSPHKIGKLRRLRLQGHIQQAITAASAQSPIMKDQYLMQKGNFDNNSFNSPYLQSMKLPTK